MMRWARRLVFLFLLFSVHSHAGSWAIFQATSSAGTFPGQPGNPVGYAATPASAPALWGKWANGDSYTATWPGAYPGSLTAWPAGCSDGCAVANGTYATSGAGTATSPYVFAGYNFNAGTGGTDISVSNAIFVDCLFQSNQTTGGAENIYVSGSNVAFFYDSVVPLVADYAAPPNAAWPSAGALQGVDSNSPTDTQNLYSISGSGPGGFQYGFELDGITGPITIDHINLWGFTNAVDIGGGSSYQITINSSWIHDAWLVNGAHVDGPGFIAGSAAPSNIAITNDTIASIGNTNGVAFQGASSGNFVNVVITGNYFSGFNYFAFLGNPVTFDQGVFLTDDLVENNVFGTDLPYSLGEVYSNYTTIFNNTYSGASGNVWRNNTLRIISGTSPDSESSPQWTDSDNGFYLWPDNTLHATDF